MGISNLDRIFQPEAKLNASFASDMPSKGKLELLTQIPRKLSPTSIYHRFFSAMKEISPAMLARFTQIDYDRHIALTALDDSSKKNKCSALPGS